MWILFFIIMGIIIISSTFEILSDLASSSESGIGKAFNAIFEFTSFVFGLVFVLAGIALYLGFFYVLIKLFTS